MRMSYFVSGTYGSGGTLVEPPILEFGGRKCLLSACPFSGDLVSRNVNSSSRLAVLRCVPAPGNYYCCFLFFLTHPHTTAACAAGVVTRTSDRDSLRYTYNGTRRVRQLASGCESN